MSNVNEQGGEGTHSDVCVEYLVAVVYGDDGILDEPSCQVGRKDVEVEKVTTPKEEKLKHVETKKGIPEPADCSSLRLWGGGVRGRLAG